MEQQPPRIFVYILGLFIVVGWQRESLSFKKYEWPLLALALFQDNFNVGFS